MLTVIYPECHFADGRGTQCLGLGLGLRQPRQPRQPELPKIWKTIEIFLKNINSGCLVKNTC